MPFFEHLQQFLTVFTVGLSLARFWRAFGISGGGVEHHQTPVGTPLLLNNKTELYPDQSHS